MGNIALITMLSICVGYNGADPSIQEETQVNSHEENYVEAPKTEISSQTIMNDIYLGEFRITAYTAGFESTGKRPGDIGYGVTASGTYVKEGRTIAADWRVLPPGTKVKIEGLDGIYIVEDKGGAIKGKKLDIYMESVNAANLWGVKKRSVWIVK